MVIGTRNDFTRDMNEKMIPWILHIIERLCEIGNGDSPAPTAAKTAELDG